MAPYPYYAGGIDSWLDNFLSSLLEDDVKINLFCFASKNMTKNDLVFTRPIDERLQIYYLPAFTAYSKGIGWLFSYIKEFKNLKIETTPTTENIVLSTVPIMAPVILLRKLRLLKGRLICSVRGQIAQDCIDLGKPYFFSKIVAYIEKTVLYLSDCVVANGNDTKSYLKSFHNIESIVAANGVSKSFFSRNADDVDLLRFDNFKGKKVFLHVGTLRPVKGIDYIVDAFGDLEVNDKENSILVFIGKGMIEHYRDRCLAKNVNALFLGHKSNVCDYLSVADFVLNVSGGSGVSNSLVETLTAGKPVIAWDKETFSQVVNSDNGVLCQNQCIKSLAVAVSDCINDKYNFNSDKIKSSVIEYRWENVYKKWKTLLFNG